jgi:hypothetical protein
MAAHILVKVLITNIDFVRNSRFETLSPDSTVAVDRRIPPQIRRTWFQIEDRIEFQCVVKASVLYGLRQVSRKARQFDKYLVRPFDQESSQNSGARNDRGPAASHVNDPAFIRFGICQSAYQHFSYGKSLMSDSAISSCNRRPTGIIPVARRGLRRFGPIQTLLRDRTASRLANAQS